MNAAWKASGPPAPWLDDGDVRLYVGDVREVLAHLPDASVDCVITSPPYWGLRDYGTGSWAGGDPDCDHVQTTMKPSTKSTLEDHGDDGRSPQLDALQGIPFRDVCGKCGAQRTDQQLGLEATPDLYVASMVAVFREIRRVLAPHGTCWVNLGDSFQNKQLVGMPWRIAFALQQRGWFLRSEIIWAKLCRTPCPNP